MKVKTTPQIGVVNHLKWPKHSLMKRLLNHRYRLVLLPLLGLPLPVDKNEAEEKVNPISVVKKVEEQTTQRYGFENDYVTYRLLPCTVSALVLFAIMLEGDAVLSSDKKQNAVHELGHLIALKAVQHPTRIDFVAIESSDLRINKVGHTAPDNYDILIDEDGQPSLKRTLQNQIVLRAGESMERLCCGYANDIGSYPDRLFTLVQRTFGFVYCLKLNPKQVVNYMKFLARLEKRTQSILRQVDPDVVNELANRLSKKGYWSAEEVESIVREFSLDKLPRFEETVQEVGRILE